MLKITKRLARNQREVYEISDNSEGSHQHNDSQQKTSSAST
ncbi:22115_t:CDS:2, partial [Gigaspora margarita]